MATEAQNRIRKQYGVRKGELHKRMRLNRQELTDLAFRAQWPSGWTEKFFNAKVALRMHALVDALAADSVIAAAYAKAEREERHQATDRSHESVLHQ